MIMDQILLVLITASFPSLLSVSEGMKVTASRPGRKKKRVQLFALFASGKKKKLKSLSRKMRKWIVLKGIR